MDRDSDETLRSFAQRGWIGGGRGGLTLCLSFLFAPYPPHTPTQPSRLLTISRSAAGSLCSLTPRIHRPDRHPQAFKAIVCARVSVAYRDEALSWPGFIVAGLS